MTTFQTTLLAAVAVAIIVTFLLRRASLRSRRELFSRRLGGSMSPRAIERLVQTGSGTATEPGIRKEQITAMLCEYAEPDVGPLSECVHLSDGTLAARRGQLFLAFWNFPAAQANHAARACAAALRWRKSRKPAGQVRMGLHCGSADVEMSLESGHAQFNATGAAVEIADYLLRLNACLGTEILVSLKTRKQIGEKFVTRKLGDFKMPRRAQPLTAYELIGPKEEEQETQAFRDEFANALQLFQTGDFYHSQLTFQRLAEEKPHDEPVKFYLARVEEVLANPPENVWEGVIDPGLA